jgi:hypothetical protein
MFRDMSGLAQTAALAQAGEQASAQGATAAGQQAANTLATVMANNTERARIAAQLLARTPAFGSGGQQPPGKGTVSERGGELNAAQEIGKQMDQSAGSEAGASSSGGGDSGAGDGGMFMDPNMTIGTPSPGTQLVADTFRRQSAGGGDGPSPAAARFAETLLENTGLDEDAFLEASGLRKKRGRTQAKRRTIQVTARFTTEIDKPFQHGDFLLRVFDGRGERFLWVSGTQSDHYVNSLPGNEIKSQKLSIMRDAVTVELRVRLLKPDHDLNPVVPIFFFGAAKVYEVPSNGALTVVADVERIPRDWTVEAPNVDAAFEKVLVSLPDQERYLHERGSATALPPGRFKVTTLVWTKRLLTRTPASIGEIY